MKDGGFFARSSLHAIDVSFPKKSHKYRTEARPVFLWCVSAKILAFS